MSALSLDAIRPAEAKAEVAPAVTVAAPPKPKKLPFRPRTFIAVGIALAVAIGGALWIALPKAEESTNAAYVEADSSNVAPRVRGLIAEVLVKHNEAVRAGQPLVRLDPEEFDARVASAQADLQTAEATVLSARAAFTELAAEQRLAESGIDAAKASITAADAKGIQAASDASRFQKLADAGAASRREADQYNAAAVAAGSETDRLRAQLGVSQNQSAAVRAHRDTLSAALAQAEAGAARARAALALAQQDQSHATILAPIDGVVGDRQADPGDYVQPGSRLMTIVPLNALYVTANFKETQVTRMAVGQPATVEVDAYPGLALKGHVESFAPGSGSEFSLLPFEPGTGNFTKIVQRVPVRIVLDADQPGLDKLRPGLSTTVKIKLD